MQQTSSSMPLHPAPPRPTRRILPHVGMVTIIMNDYPTLKYALIGVLGLLVITNKENA